ncbi:MAG: hypothetical protein JST53_04965, partial [Actinobacteria bacterium]|nr:hypothetical protein [Actinomycetota bacterium]
TCSITPTVYRLNSSGAFDPTFGGAGSVQLPTTTRLEGGEAQPTMTVDRSGRLLIAQVENGGVFVRRFTAAGNLDRSFGSGGAISFPCPECERTSVWLLPAPNGRVVVERQTTLPPKPGAFSSSLGGQVALTRLTRGGRPELHFGDAGTVTIRLGRRGYPGKAAVSPKGAILLGAVECCSGNAPYLVRVSSKGRIDTKFGRAAGRSLARLSRQGETSSLRALLPRANGTVEILGNDAIGAGFDLRLKANGDRATFGRGGLRKLPFMVEAARLGSEGGIFAVGRSGTGPYSAFRLLADGRVDPAYGAQGIAVPLSGSGYTLGTPSHGKVLVFDAGDHECREGCPSTPAVARFDEGTRQG